MEHRMSGSDNTQESALQRGNMRALYPEAGQHAFDGLYLGNDLRHCVPQRVSAFIRAS